VVFVKGVLDLSLGRQPSWKHLTRSAEPEALVRAA
jgi:hypothetical protein